MNNANTIAKGIVRRAIANGLAEALSGLTPAQMARPLSADEALELLHDLGRHFIAAASNSSGRVH